MTCLSFVLLFAFALMLTVNAFPGGAPLPACATMRPLGHGSMGLNSNQLGYSLSTTVQTFEPNEVVQVMIEGPNAFRGIFLQVREMGSNEATGVWSPPSPLYQPVSCFRRAGSALTHRTRQDKPTGTTYAWQAPPSCTPGTVYNVRATVVRTFSQYQTGLTTQIRCAPEAPPPPPITTTLAPPPPPTTTTQAPPPPFTFTLAPPPPRTTTMPPPPPTNPPVSLPTATGSCIFPAPVIVNPGYATGFENGNLGGWVNVGDRPWLVNSGNTRSYGTGPTNSYAGDNYAYFEASNPAQPNNVGVIETSGQIQGCFCLRFAHSMRVNMRGHEFQVRANDNIAMVLSGLQQNGDWVRRSIQFDTGFPVTLSFRVTRGVDWMGDIAVDNVDVTPGSCRS